MTKITWFAARLFALFLVLQFVSPKPGSTQVMSPPAKASCAFAGGKTIRVNYASPRMRGRKIFGGLVPYGEEWRMGADEATSLVTTSNLVVGGKKVPAGSYTLFALPAPTKWTLIISKKTGEWGIPYPGAQFDLVRTDMKVAALSSPLENFTISFGQSGTACTMNLDWERTRASIEMSEDK